MGRRLVVTVDPAGRVHEQGIDHGSTHGTVVAYNRRTSTLVVKWPGRSVYGGQLGHRTYAPTCFVVYRCIDHTAETVRGATQHRFLTEVQAQWDRHTEPELPDAA